MEYHHQISLDYQQRALESFSNSIPYSTESSVANRVAGVTGSSDAGAGALVQDTGNGIILFFMGCCKLLIVVQCVATESIVMGDHDGNTSDLYNKCVHGDEDLPGCYTKYSIQYIVAVFTMKLTCFLDSCICIALHTYSHCKREW